MLIIHFFQFRQTLLALIFDLASSPVKPLMWSSFAGSEWVSTAITLCPCLIRFASKSLMLLHLILTDPPRLQISAWLTLHSWPQGPWEGSSRSTLAYRSFRASLNSPLFRTKPNSSSASKEGQLDPHFSLVSPMALLTCSVNFSSMFFDFWTSADSFCRTIVDLVTAAKILSGST